MTFDEAKTILENDNHFLPLDPTDESYGVDGIYISTEPKPEYRNIVMEALEVDSCRPLDINQNLLISCSVMKDVYATSQQAGQVWLNQEELNQHEERSLKAKLNFQLLFKKLTKMYR